MDIRIPNMWFIKMLFDKSRHFITYTKAAGCKSFIDCDVDTETEVKCDAYMWLIKHRFILP